MSMLLSCNKTETTDKDSLSVSARSLHFQAAGNTAQTVTVTASGDFTWEASAEGESKEWIVIETSQDMISVNVSDNESGQPRQGTINIVPSADNISPVTIEVSQDAPEAPEAVKLDSEGLITYYAKDFTYSTNGTDEWLINLFTEGSDYEISWFDFGKDGYWNYDMKEGQVISLYLYNSPYSDFFNPVISEGTYTACYEIGKMEPMTMMTSDYYSGTPWPQGSFISNYKNAEVTSYTDIKDGKVTLSIDGDNYSISAELVTGDGNTAVYEFTGKLSLSILGNPPYYSDLTEDVEIAGTEIERGAIAASYTNIADPEVTEWKVQFMGKDITVDELGLVSGTGYFVNVHLLAPASEEETIPDGEYPISAADSYTDVKAFTALKGTYNPLMGNSGCYMEIYSEDDLAFGPMSDGKITTHYLGEDRYSFTIDAMDDNGHKITFSYEGTLTR